MLGKIVCKEVIGVELNVECVNFEIIDKLKNICEESSRKKLSKLRKVKKEVISEKKMDDMV